MKLHSKCNLLLEIPVTNPISTINSFKNKILVGTWNGYFYQICIEGSKETVEYCIEPSYPIRYINISEEEMVDIKDSNTNDFFCYELILGSSCKSKIRSFNKANTPVVPIEELTLSPDTHHQMIEIKSNIDFYDNFCSGKFKDKKENEPPLFLFSSTINSYFGFNVENGDIEIRLCNFHIPDKELVILDYDYIDKQIMIVERSPERLEYYTLCSLKILQLFERDISSNEFQFNNNICLTDIPPKYLLNFPFKHPILVTSQVISELTFKSSHEYKSFRNPHIYNYCYSTLFSMSNFRKKRSIFNSMFNISNAKFWGQNSIILVVSNHVILNIDLYYCVCDEFNTSTFSNNKFHVKSPDSSITAISTSNSNYVVALTECNRIFVCNRKGEIVYLIKNGTPYKYRHRWVWPIYILVLNTGIIIFTTLNGLCYAYCDILDMNIGKKSNHLKK